MRYRARVIQHRTLDIIVEAATREEAAYECAFTKEEEQK